MPRVPVLCYTGSANHSAPILVLYCKITCNLRLAHLNLPSGSRVANPRALSPTRGARSGDSQEGVFRPSHTHPPVISITTVHVATKAELIDEYEIESANCCCPKARRSDPS